MSTYIAVGSVCWDVVEGSCERRLGGSVLFAARVAIAKGWKVHVVTSGTDELADAARIALPGADFTVQPSAVDTVFEFSQRADLGPQRVRSRAEPIDLAAVDLAAVDLDVGAQVDDRDSASPTGVVHLAPVLGELTAEAFDADFGGRLVGLTPQGLLRSVGPDGALLRHGRLDPWWVDRVGALVLSEDEHALLADPAALDPVRCAVTRGERGCVGLWRGEAIDVAGIDLADVDPVGTIGAGDTFAAAFLLALAEGLDFAAALAEANRTAAAHVAGHPLP